MHITDEAMDIVNGDRLDDYGDTLESFDRIAGLWSAYLSTPITAEQVAHLMILMKVSRDTHKFKRDNRVDIVGYAICLDKILKAREPEEERF